MKVDLIPLERIIPDPHNPRIHFTPSCLDELAVSIKIHGIKVPLIGFEEQGKIMLCDGHCRFEAAKSLSMLEVPVIVLARKPDEADLLSTQLTISVHRSALNPVDEYEAFTRLSKLKRWTASELATGLAVSNAEVTRVLAIGKLSPEERQFVRDGRISKSAAYALSRMASDQRAAVAEKAASGELNRDQLNSQARKKKQSEEVKTRRVSCRVAAGTVSVQAPNGLNLPGLIELLEGLVRECRKARKLGVDISTAMKMLRDRSQQPLAAAEHDSLQ